MRFLKLNLTEFLLQAYKINIEELFDPSNFYIDDISWIIAYDDEVERIREQYNLTKKDDKLIAEAIKRAKYWAYERTYFNEYVQEAKEIIGKKIHYDFKHLNNFFDGASGEFFVDGEVLVKKIDWKNDEIVFEGKLSKLETYVVNACNGYGIFRYDSMDEFRHVHVGYTLKERIESHMHWLKYMEDIYGTIHYFFQIDLDSIDPYGTLGNTDFNKDEIEAALENEGVMIA